MNRPSMAFRRFYSAPDRGRFFDKEKGHSFPACVPASFITAANQMNRFLSSASISIMAPRLISMTMTP